MIYFSGLGRPFKLGNLDSPRHWLNRAWTLQELPRIDDHLIVAGMAACSPPIKRLLSWDATFSLEEAELAKFHRKLTNMRHARRSYSVPDLARVMVSRHATNDLDKIAGLVYALCCNPLPIYDTTTPLDVAWSRLALCTTTMERWDRLNLLLFYPGSREPGKHHKEHPVWLPQWGHWCTGGNVPGDQEQEVVAESLVTTPLTWTIPESLSGFVWMPRNLDDQASCLNSLCGTVENSRLYTVDGLYVLESCNIRGFSAGSGCGNCSLSRSCPRNGQLAIRSGEANTSATNDGASTDLPPPELFKLAAYHSDPIADGQYAVVGCPQLEHDYDDESWLSNFPAVLGHLEWTNYRDPPRLAKVSVVVVEFRSDEETRTFRSLCGQKQRIEFL